MRILTAVSILALAVSSQFAQAQERPLARAKPAEAAKVYSTDESAAMAASSREKAEAAALARDKRLRKATGGICTGC
jgi:hypothetical protein